MALGSTEPFDFPGDGRGVLLVHGFTGTPFEMRYLGRRLADEGFTVKGPLLAGHGQSAQALGASTWHDWMETVERELLALRHRCHAAAVVGLSLGGLLALHLAVRRPDEVAAIGALSVPLWLPLPVRLAIRFLGRVDRLVGGLPAVPKTVRGGDVGDLQMRRQNPSLSAYPIAALASFEEFTRIVRSELGQVTVPAFVAHGERDRTALPACSREIVRRLGSQAVRYLTLPRSFHLIPIDVERDRLADELIRFLGRRFSTWPPRRDRPGPPPRPPG